MYVLKDLGDNTYISKLDHDDGWDYAKEQHKALRWGTLSDLLAALQEYVHAKNVPIYCYTPVKLLTPTDRFDEEVL